MEVLQHGLNKLLLVEVRSSGVPLILDELGWHIFFFFEVAMSSGGRPAVASVFSGLAGCQECGYYSEHAQIYDRVAQARASPGLAVVAGDKHSFWAGLTPRILRLAPTIRWASSS